MSAEVESHNRGMCNSVEGPDDTGPEDKEFSGGNKNSGEEPESKKIGSDTGEGPGSKEFTCQYISLDNWPDSGVGLRV